MAFGWIGSLFDCRRQDCDKVGRVAANLCSSDFLQDFKLCAFIQLMEKNMPCDVDSLKSQTENYWRNLQDANSERARDGIVQSVYLESLLRDEIACAKERALTQEGVWPQEQAEVLVLLVGHSIEPLLQTVCAYEPKEIVLVLSQKYNAPNDGMLFAEDHVLPCLRALKELESPLLKRHFAELRCVCPKPGQGSRPGDVFQLLFEALSEDVKKKKNIIIDITGGKKSMVAGAYFFATYTNVKISYVDFEDYHERKRRPYGFSCQIGLLPNPYEIFGLRDWEQVKSLYKRFFFDEAVKKLCIIAKDMSSEYFKPEQITAVETLIKIMRVYHAWSVGDYAQAKKLSDEVKVLQPLASVEALHDKWPENIDSEPRLRLSDWDFYSNHKLILQYALDESAKVDRIVKLKEDYRSGLLRAAGLNEVLLKARLAFLCERKMLLLYRKDQKLADADAQNTVVDGQQVKAWFAEEILRAKNKEKVPAKAALKAEKTENALPYMSQSPEYRAILTKDRDLRNGVIHFVIPVSKQIAYEAVDAMHKNVQDFEQVWVQSVDPKHQIKPDTLPTWEELCGWCNIDFLLHPKKQEKQS